MASGPAVDSSLCTVHVPPKARLLDAMLEGWWYTTVLSGTTAEPTSLLRRL